MGAIAVALGGSLLLGPPGEGRAHAAVFQVDPTVGAGYATIASPAPTGGTDVVRRKDGFFSFGLAARLSINGALLAQSLGYSLFATEYFGSTIPSNLAQSASYQLSGTPTGRSQLSVAVLASRASTSSATPVDAATGSTTATPLGGTTQIGTGVNETFSYSPVGTQTYSEAASVFLSRVSGVTNLTSLQLSGTLTARKTSGRDGFALIGTATSVMFLDVPSNPTGQQVADPGTLITSQLLAGWDRQHSASVTTSVQAGALFLARPQFDQYALGPAGNASINYTSFPWFASLSVFQQPTVNLFVGNAVIADGAALRVSLPLSQKHLWTVTGLAGYTYGRAVTPHQGLVQWDRAYDLVTFGVTSTYVFPRYPIFVSLNYTGSSQRGSRSPTVGFPNSARSLLWLNVGASFGFGEGSRGFLRQ